MNVIGFRELGDGDESFKKFDFDLSVAREENIALMSHDWTGMGDKIGTAMDVGFLKEDMIDTAILSLDDERDFPAEFVTDGPVLAYLQFKKDIDPETKLSYVGWLELEWFKSVAIQSAVSRLTDRLDRKKKNCEVSK